MEPVTHRLNSTAIYGFTYYPSTKVLAVRFFDGGISRFLGVPAAVVDEWLKASSKGRFFNTRIRGTYG